MAHLLAADFASLLLKACHHRATVGGRLLLSTWGKSTSMLLRPSVAESCLWTDLHGRSLDSLLLKIPCATSLQAAESGRCNDPLLFSSAVCELPPLSSNGSWGATTTTALKVEASPADRIWERQSAPQLADFNSPQETAYPPRPWGPASHLSWGKCANEGAQSSCGLRSAVERLPRSPAAVWQAHPWTSHSSMRGLHTGPPMCSPAPLPAKAPGARRPVVAVGMSGGVDSAVSALLLQRAGYEVVGLFMRNWDTQEEDDAGQCSADQDLKDAKHACAHLGVPLQEVNFVRRYWTDVFEHFVAECAQGLTPNPDLACNRHIKFDALLQHALAGGADLLATGHYARVAHAPEAGPAQLLRGRDPSKDQSYFLAQVEGHALQHVVFPVGSYLKSEVRQLAAEAGLLNASKRSSRGICFVGKRRFDKFIAKYVHMNPGPFVDVETGRTVGKHIGLAAYTNGQRARISGSSNPWFVVGKRADGDVVFVAQGKDHPALYANTALATPVFWVAGGPPKEVGNGAKMQCQYKARYLQPTRECIVEMAGGGQQGVRHGSEVGNEFQRSEYSQIDVPEIQGSDAGLDVLYVRFKENERALTPRQALVLYDGDVCLGGGLLAHPGQTTFEKSNLELHHLQVRKVA